MGVLPHMWVNVHDVGHNAHAWYIAPSQWYFLSLIITYNISNFIETNICLILDIIVVCLNITTSWSIA